MSRPKGSKNKTSAETQRERLREMHRRQVAARAAAQEAEVPQPVVADDAVMGWTTSRMDHHPGQHCDTMAAVAVDVVAVEAVQMMTMAQQMDQRRMV